jgi:Tol biopolymer transport system component
VEPLFVGTFTSRCLSGSAEGEIMNPIYIKSIARVIAVTMLLAMLAGLTPGAVLPAYAAPGDITRVSVDSSGVQANGGSNKSAISDDGRFIAFASDASNLASGDTNNAEDIFVKDRQTGAITRVSVSSNGTEANGTSTSPAISGDGRFVAFYSEASDLLNGDTNGFGDIFVHDRQTSLTTRVSVDSSGVEANAPPSSDYGVVSISGDGRFVAFYSDASNLVSGDTNGVSDIFVYDRQTGWTTRASVASNGSESNGGSAHPNLSGGGRYITFISGATNLITGDTNGKADVFVRDLQTGSTTRVSVNTSGSQADGGGTSPDISGDGRYVVFMSASGNLDPRADEYRYSELVYVHDRQTGQTTLASVYSDGRIMEVGLFDQPTIARNGRYVAFSFYEKGNNNGILNIWVRDLQTGTSISVNYGNASSGWPSLSANGSIVAFSSGASNLVGGDTNGTADVFVRELAYGTERNPTVASVTPDCGYSTPACTYPTPASVPFIVIFSEPVSGVTTDDFFLEMLEGITGASITGVSGYGVEYFVTVATGIGDGRLRLNVVDNDSIVDTVLNPLGGVGMDNGNFTGKKYMIDKNFPIVTGIVRADPNPAIAGTVRFTVTFSEVVYPVMPDDFVLSTTGSIVGAAITTVDPIAESATYTVTVNTGTGDGTLRLDLIDDDSISDNFIGPIGGMPLGGAGAGNGNFTTGEAYTIGNNIPSAPSVISSLRVDFNPTGSGAVNFAVTFSEDVSGVDASDFILNGNVSGAVIVAVTGSGKSYNVQVNTGSGEGTLGIYVIDNDSIRDADNYPLGGDGTGNGTFIQGEEYTIDRAPRVMSILRLDPNPTSADAISFAVTFSESVSGIEVGDFTTTITGNIYGAMAVSVSGSGSAYIVTVNTGRGDGTLRLDVLDNDSIVDATSNPLGGAGTGNGNYTAGDAYQVEKNAPPVVISILRTDPTPTTATSVHFKLTFSEPVINVDADDFVLTRTGNLSAYISDISSSANIYTITISASSGAGSGTLRLDLIDNDSIMDSATQPLGGLGAGNGSFTTGEVYTISIAPTILSTSYRSTGSSDGWVLESSENSNVGGSKNSSASVFKLGDDAQNRQFRSVLHFPTYYLPDNAVVTQAILMIKKQDVIGTDPFTTHQNISIDIRKGYFSNFNLFSFGSLQDTDYQAAADMYMVGTIQNNPVSGWYWALLDSRALPYINLTDVTQLRLGFLLDDNNDLGDDYIRFYSGDYDAQKDRPHLLIEYYVSQ